MSGRSRLVMALDQTGATVTAVLERLVGEPIDVYDARHRMTVATAPNPLEVGAGHPLLQRIAVLRGRVSAQPYVYAESLLVPSRLSVDFLQQLGTGTDPIGRLLVDQGIAFSRSPLPPPDGVRGFLPGDALGLDEHLLARAYRVEVDGLPAMVITEWFLPGLAASLGPA